MGKVTLVTGGARSGKSRFVLERAARKSPRVFIATAEAIDDEMAARIESHQRERGAGYDTIEEPVDLAGAFVKVPADTAVVVVDCLTVWLNNVIYRRGLDRESYPEVEELLELLGRPLSFDLILVTNEVGWGIVPEGALARRYRDDIGALNQHIAAMADEVVLVVSGLHLTVKGEKT